MAKKRTEQTAIIEGEPEVQVEASEYDLPPKGFAFFLLAQRADNKITESLAAEKLRAYFQQFSGRKLDEALSEARMFLGRISSVASHLTKEF